MKTDFQGREKGTPAKQGRNKFISFFLLFAASIAFGILSRYYHRQPSGGTDASWNVYFSDVYDGRFNDASLHFLEGRLVEKLAIASERIDAAIYELSSEPVVDTLIEAHRRGVQVRIVTETDSVKKPQITRLQKVGISVVDDGEYSGLMHHKFVVIDERYVWTGSYNFTYNGTHKNNNNVLWIDSLPLAYNYTQKFREMFLTGTFGKGASSSLPYPRVNLSDGTQISAYFAPEHDTISPLLSEIRAAEHSIHFMAFSFTHDALGKAMRDSSKSGVMVKGVFEKRQVDRHSEFEAMKKAKIPVTFDNNSGTMHHKVIVVDEETVITGSYNFSRNAETRNSENLLIINGNRELAGAYLAEFERLIR